jgi:predicted component of type VI protein secretion system
MRSPLGSGVVIVALLVLAGCAAKKYDRISGDTPNEVAVSITLVADELPPDKEAAFVAAVDLLRMTATDRFGASKFASITPQMAMQLKGRTAADVIQMATVYRSAIPVYPSNKDLGKYAARE